MKTAQQVQQVSINLTDGEQIVLDGSDTIRGSLDFGIELGDIKDTLSDPDAWIEYETESRREPPDDEPWRQASEWRPATCRLFGRAVCSVLVTYGDG